jgi:protein-glucosylgalactosylhydroxylysine glucosidase
MRFVFAILVFCLPVHALRAQQKHTINREEVVRRHTIHITKADPLASLTVGNGRFAFTADVTGLQSFPSFYEKGVPLGTQSEWGWHSFPNAENYRMEETMRVYELEGRKIPYPVQLKEPERNRKAVDYFRVNPHRLQLGNIGFEFLKKDGSPAQIIDIADIDQSLDLWTGEIISRFSIEGETVHVSTFCNSGNDAVAIKVQSRLISDGRLKLRVILPYPTGEWKDPGTNRKDDEKHKSVIWKSSLNSATIRHQLDYSAYYIGLRWEGKGLISTTQDHCFVIKPEAGQTSFVFAAQFIPESPLLTGGAVPGYQTTMHSSRKAWQKFWQSGGAVDLAGSTDKRAFELERRIILSQYLIRVQEASGFPPQETGLTYNSWYGKPHLEMHWWHAVHYALWGRTALLEKSLDWYFTAAGKAKDIAKRQGFDGLRWQKMTDHDGGESPSSIGSFLVWQQPHFIYMAELLYREKKDKKILAKYKDLLFATADFMASFPSYDPQTKKYNLGRGLIPAQERFDAETTYNPTYELAYWSWALDMAQQWRERLGLLREKKWDEIIHNLAPLPQKDSVYLATESTPDCYTTERYLTDHPAVLAAYASIPAANGLDTAVMKKTFDLVWSAWHWNDTWGWDFPLTAMAATRLNKPVKAIDALLMPVPKNTYLPNGHNYQDERLTIYLPGNGGLLSAVAMMCAGYDGCKTSEPGFPKDGSWRVKWEGLKRIF